MGYANVTAFLLNKPSEAITFLKTNDNQDLYKFEESRYLMVLADAQVAEGLFNQALINYSKIQKRIKTSKKNSFCDVRQDGSDMF